MEHSLHILLYRAFHAQRNYLRPGLQELGLGTGQPKLLAYLAARGPCRQRQLADYFDVDPANVSRMVSCLEKGGFQGRFTALDAHEDFLPAFSAWEETYRDGNSGIVLFKGSRGNHLEKLVKVFEEAHAL